MVGGGGWGVGDGGWGMGDDASCISRHDGFLSSSINGMLCINNAYLLYEHSCHAHRLSAMV